MSFFKHIPRQAISLLSKNKKFIFFGGGMRVVSSLISFLPFLGVSSENQIWFERIVRGLGGVILGVEYVDFCVGRLGSNDVALLWHRPCSIHFPIVIYFHGEIYSSCKFTGKSSSLFCIQDLVHQ